MARGKFAARAANRMASLDNQLLRDQHDEIDALKSMLAEVRQQLADERRERGSLVLQRADQLAAEKVADARQELAEVKEAHVELLRTVARHCAQIFRNRSGDGEVVTYDEKFIETLLPVLLPNRKERSAFIDDMIGRKGVNA